MLKQITEKSIEQLAIRKMTYRLIPLLLVCYVVSYIDRSNIAYAALQMNSDLGLSQAAFAFGAGIFFLGYCVFEIPSNLLLHRFGARRWIARIMVTWGIFAAAMAFVWDKHSFYVLRFLFGMAEAGFFPGVVYYLSCWFPASHRGRVMGVFLAALPVSGIISGPMSGALLLMDGIWGLAGWQWLFIVQAAPAIFLAPLILFWLPDTPNEAEWLSLEEKEWLAAQFAEEEVQKSTEGNHLSSLKSLMHPMVIGLALIYFAIVACLNSISFFLPQILKQSGLSNLETGFAASISNLIALGIVLFWSRHSDRTQERKWHTAIALIVGATALIVAASSDNLIIQIAAFAIALGGALSSSPCFWAMPPMFLSGIAKAGGIGAISSIGVLGGFVAPVLIGYLTDRSGNFALGQTVIAVFVIAAAIFLILLGGQRFSKKAT